jgi:hypothetical protein
MNDLNNTRLVLPGHLALRMEKELNLTNIVAKAVKFLYGLWKQI